MQFGNCACDDCVCLCVCFFYSACFTYTPIFMSVLLVYFPCLQISLSVAYFFFFAVFVLFSGLFVCGLVLYVAGDHRISYLSTLG